jgi:hypothetical protein
MTSPVPRDGPLHLGDRLAAVDRRAIALRFVLTALVFLVAGSIVAAPMPGVALVVLGALPILNGMALLLLPILLGARDAAFPRLSAYGYWCFLCGGAGLLAALALGGRDAAPVLWVAGTVVAAVGLIVAMAVLLVSILRLRRPDLRLTRLPPAVWLLAGGALLALVCLPPLLVGSLVLDGARLLDLPFFDPARGGDPAVWYPLAAIGEGAGLAALGTTAALALWLAPRLRLRPARQGGAVLPQGWRGALAVDARSGRPDQILLMPARSLLPLAAALATAAATYNASAHAFPAAGALAALALALILSWPPHAATLRDHGRRAGHTGLPPHTEAERPPALSGLRLAILADGAALAALSLGGVALALTARGWADMVLPVIPTGLQLVTAASLIGCVATADKALRRGYRSVLDILGAWMWALAVLLTCVAMMQTVRGVTGHAGAAMHMAMYLWLAVHAGLGVILASVALWRRLAGRLSDARRTDLRLLRLWHRWLFVTGALVLAYPHALLALTGAGIA